MDCEKLVTMNISTIQDQRTFSPPLKIAVRQVVSTPANHADQYRLIGIFIITYMLVLYGIVRMPPVLLRT